MSRRTRRHFGELEVRQHVSREQRCQGEEKSLNETTSNLILSFRKPQPRETQGCRQAVL